MVDSEDDELRWLEWCNADLTFEQAVVQVDLCHHRAVAPDKESIIRLYTFQTSVSLFVEQENH